MEEKIQKAEELHQAIKDRASRLGRRKVHQQGPHIPFYSRSNPSSASLCKPITGLKNISRVSAKKLSRCFINHNNREMIPHNFKKQNMAVIT